MKILTSENLQSAPNDPKLNSKNRTLKVLYICALQYSEPKIFARFALRAGVFKILHIFWIFPLTPMLKFQSATFFFNFWQIAKTFITLYSLMNALFIINFGSHWHKNCRSSVLKFPAPYGPALTKISKCNKIFKFC